MQLHAFGARQGEDSDESARQLLHQSLSSGSLRLVRLSAGDSAAAHPQDSASGGEDRNLYIRDNDEDEDEGEEDEDEEEMQLSYWHPPYAKTPKWFPPVTTPQEEGKRLLVSGEFGRIGFESRSRHGDSSFAKAILSRQTKLRQTPMQDVTNVSRVHILVCNIPHSHECRLLFPTLMVQQLRLLPITYTVDNTQLVRIHPDCDVLVSYSVHADSSFYYTCCRGIVPLSPSVFALNFQ